MTAPDPQVVMVEVLEPHRFVGHASEAAGWAHICACGYYGPHPAHLAAVLATDPRIAIVAKPVGYPCGEDDATAHFDAIGDTGEGYREVGRRYVIQCCWCNKVFGGRTKAQAIERHRKHEDALREKFMVGGES